MSIPGRNVNLFLPEELFQKIEEFTSENAFTSRTAAIRYLIEQGFKADVGRSSIEERLNKVEAKLKEISTTSLEEYSRMLLGEDLKKSVKKTNPPVSEQLPDNQKSEK